MWTHIVNNDMGPGNPNIYVTTKKMCATPEKRLRMLTSPPPLPFPSLFQHRAYLARLWYVPTQSVTINAIERYVLHMMRIHVVNNDMDTYQTPKKMYVTHGNVMRSKFLSPEARIVRILSFLPLGPSASFSTQGGEGISYISKCAVQTKRYMIVIRLKNYH